MGSGVRVRVRVKVRVTVTVRVRVRVGVRVRVRGRVRVRVTSSMKCVVRSVARPALASAMNSHTARRDCHQGDIGEI